MYLKMCELCTNCKNCAICKDLCYVHVQKPWRTQIWPRHHSRPLGLIKHRSDNLLHAKLERGFHIFRPSNIRLGSKLYFHSTKFVISGFLSRNQVRGLNNFFAQVTLHSKTRKACVKIQNSKLLQYLFFRQYNVRKALSAVERLQRERKQYIWKSERSLRLC